MKHHPDLLNDSVHPLYLKYLAPSVSATLVTSIYILADTVMIGRGVGPIGIAALNILLPVFSLLFGMGMLFGVGGSVMLSISKGRGNEQAAREYFTIACLLAAAASILYLLAFNLFFDQITGLLGRNNTMDAYVRQYGYVIAVGGPAFLFSSFLQAFVRNDKAPKKAMVAVISGGVTNVILDYLFIFPMNMGMAGGAIASVIGTLLTLAILLTHFFTPANTLKLAPVFSVKKGWEVCVNGFASFLLEMSNGVVMFLFNRQTLAYVGDIGVVVYGIISNSALIVASVSNGIAQAAQPLLAVNFGAGKTDRVRQTQKLACLVVGISGVLFFAIGFAFPGLVASAFVKPTQEIMDLAVPAIRLYFISFLAMGFNILFSTFFQSEMKPAYSLTICLLRGLVINGILVFALPLIFGVNGIWITMAGTEGVTLAVGVWLLLGKSGKRKRGPAGEKASL